MDKRFWTFLIIIAVILTGVALVTNNKKAGAPAESKGVLTNHVQGKSSSGVKLVEYGDFQCPGCGSYYASVKQTAAKYDGIVSFQFRNFPLSSLHPNAIAAARAAEAADMQGKYWEMHDKLYEENVTYIVAQQQGKQYQTWISASDPMSYFESYATAFGLNITKFKADFKSKTANDRIQTDLKEGTRLGVNSTPTFFLDGKKISNPDPTVEAFSKIIDAEIIKKGGTLPNITPPATTEPAPAQTEQ